MPRRPLRCVVDLSIHAVSAPGVWLPSKEDIYLSVSMLGQYRNSRLLTSVFPLVIGEKFRFEKTYYTALDPAEVSDYLEDELVVFEIVQLSEYTDGAVRLASFSTNARDFLFPYPSLAPCYSSTDRELLLTRTVAFPGISPKLEYATKTIIKESISPEVDALEEALEEERLRRQTYRKLRRSPTRRSRSPSLTRRIADLDLADTVDPRPPFVVRKLETSLIGRSPGGGPDAHAKSKTKKGKLRTTYSSDDLDLARSSLRSRKSYHLDKVIREPLKSPLPVYSSKYDDEDAEVAELTSRTSSYYASKPRPRSASPLRYRPSFESRYGARTSTYSPPLYSSYLDYPYSYYPRYYSKYDPYLLDLEIATNLAKTRRYLSLY